MSEKYTNSLHLKLYITVGCHLCEDAKELMAWVQKNAVEPFPKLQFQEIDIADSDDLIEKYGVHIPVVAYANGAETAEASELRWPFTPEQFYDFVQELVR